MKTSVFSLLICALLAFAVANAQTIRIEVSSDSNSNWIAISVQNADIDTSSVQIKEASTDSWVEMVQVDGYWAYSSLSTSLQFPLSFRLASINGDKLTVTNAIRFLTDSVDTGKQYSSIVPRSNHGHADMHSSHTTTEAPSKHTSSPTTTKASHTSTAAPSKQTTTKAPSTSTKASSTTTTKATAKASTTTSKPASTIGSTSGCSAAIKLLVPLYSYPDSSWDTVASGASSVGTVAIINPDSGPGSGPDSTYNTYMTKLHAAGVEMIGYVHTSYGARAIADVKADIDAYASQFPLVVGIFIDEASASSSEVSYYSEVYSYIMSFPGWKYDVLNPGAVPSSGYTAVATQIVSYESTTSGFSSSENPSFASCSNKNMFAMITYSGTSSTMQTAISAAKTKGYYGWVYVTDGTASGDTYGSLPSFYSTMVSYIANTIN